LYAKVLAQIQALSPKERADVFKFQEHRRSYLPLVLWGENPTTVEVQKTKAEGSKDSTPDQEEQQDKEEQAGGPKQEAEASILQASQLQSLLQGNHLNRSVIPLFMLLPCSQQREYQTQVGFLVKN
jgi:hypothetical protein